MSQKQPSPWLHSARVDLAVVLVPLLLAALAFGVQRLTGFDEPLWAYLLGFVALDVAHVWATAFVTYLDPARFAARRQLYVWVIPVCFGAAALVHAASSVAFWTAISYFAIFHFVRQQVGFVMLYKARVEPRSAFDYHLDKAAVYVGALWPILIWHAAPRGQFDWFSGEEQFLFRLDPGLIPVVTTCALAFALIWAVRQLERWRAGDAISLGKVVWIGGSWISWSAGIALSDNLLVSACFLNFFHGLPFIALVYARVRVGGRAAPGHQGQSVRARLLDVVRSRGGFFVMYGALLVVALVEELGWESVVWRSYLPALGFSSTPMRGPPRTFFIALLATPQLVHYVLDAFIWKLNDHNRDFLRLLREGVAGRSQVEAPPVNDDERSGGAP